MEILRKPIVAAFAISICGIIFYLANNKSFFGKVVNSISPCVQNPVNSFPCYGIFDIVAMIAATLIGLLFLAILGYATYQAMRS